MTYESTIVINQPIELSYFLYIMWLGPFLDRTDLGISTFVTPCPTICPQNSTFGSSNTHFVGRAYMRCYRNASNTSRRCSRCSSSELEYTKISSRYTRTNLSMYGRKIEFISV